MKRVAAILLPVLGLLFSCAEIERQRIAFETAAVTRRENAREARRAQAEQVVRDLLASYAQREAEIRQSGATVEAYYLGLDLREHWEERPELREQLGGVLERVLDLLTVVAASGPPDAGEVLSVKARLLKTAGRPEESDLVWVQAVAAGVSIETGIRAIEHFAKTRSLGVIAGAVLARAKTTAEAFRVLDAAVLHSAAITADAALAWATQETRSFYFEYLERRRDQEAEERLRWQEEERRLAQERMEALSSSLQNISSQMQADSRCRSMCASSAATCRSQCFGDSSCQLNCGTAEMHCRNGC